MSVQDELVEFLDYAAEAAAKGDTNALTKLGFVWGQRRDHVLNDGETFAKQSMTPPLFPWEKE